MKAYIISDGLVQIGTQVFEITSRKTWKTTMKGIKGKPAFEVEDKTWDAAWEAWKKYMSQSLSQSL